jgi:transposase
MEVVNPVCCGLDVHKASITACLRQVMSGGMIKLENRTFDTNMRGLTSLLDWLMESECRIAAMESTGVYWRPVYHVLSPVLTVWVANPAEVKQRRGKKTDKADAQWIAELLAHDLIQPSFIPPAEINALRDMVRTRTALVNNRTQAKNRVLAILEDTNIKLSSVASDTFGKSGRAMIDALVDGHRDPKALAQMAKGILKRKIPQLEAALEGSFTEHHAFLIQVSLSVIDLLDKQIAELDKHVESMVIPLRKEVDVISSIPGVSETSARAIISETGIDMNRFVTDTRLVAWACMCPGNNESAGKRKRGKTRKGNRYLRRMLVECAWAAGKTDSFLGRTFRRLQARIGGKKAAVAVGHKILVIIFHLLNEGVLYDEGRYNHLSPREEEKQKKRAVETLQRLGFNVTISLAA